MGLFKRGGIFYGRVKDDSGAWVAKTLNTKDRLVAQERYRELERYEAIPSYRAPHETTLERAAAEFITNREVKGCAKDTIDMYDQKLAHWERLLGANLPIARIDAPKVDRCLATRLKEGASRNTIGKELTALRGLLKVAKRAGKFPGDIDAILPIEWSNDYEPRRTALLPDQVAELVKYLAAPKKLVSAKGNIYERDDDPERSMNRAAFVAFIVATGARFSEATRATQSQINLKRGFVYFTITKTWKKGKREKYVPVDPLNEDLLKQVLAVTPKHGPMFKHWGNVRRDLPAACTELKIPKITPTDLRRTYSNWRRGAGVDLSTLADCLGHVDSRMLEKVYGKLRPEQLKALVVAAVSTVVH